MDRAFLERLLEEGLSLAEIGRRVGRHESTVAYWVEKHGLGAVNRDEHTARGVLTREQLAPLVAEGMTIAKIAETVDRSKATVRHWLRKYGLDTSAKSRRERRRAARTTRLPTIIDRCERHETTEHYLDHAGFYRCKRCRAERVIRRRRRVKQILVSEWGGCCALCGYDRYFGALEFHHLDPAEKRFGLSVRGLARSLAALRREAQKCILLCSNCHAEVEGGVSSVSGVARRR
jgi:transposase